MPSTHSLLLSTRRPIAALLATLLIALGAIVVDPAPSGAAPAGGPVILDGTDSGLHGSYSGGALQSTWIYAARAYENLLGAATGTSNDRIAVLGAADSTATANDCGAMAHYAAASLDPAPGVDYYNGADAINAFFAALAGGAVRPKVIHIVESNYCGNGQDSAEASALTTNATAIADFVNDGGGLYAQYQAYGWLTALLPDVAFGSGGGSSPELTVAGQAAFPGLSNGDIAAPWHGHFTGDLGGLEVLAQQSGTQNVIIGGGSVTLPGSFAVAAPASQHAGTTVSITATAQRGGAAVAAATIGFEVTSGPNVGTTGSAVSDVDGEAVFDYVGTGGAGTDTIEASWDDEGTPRTATTTFTWTEPPVPGVPGGLTLTSRTLAFSLDWEAPTTGAAVVEYQVRYRRTGGSWQVVTVTETEGRIVNIPAGTYEVEVVPVGAGGAGTAATGTVVVHDLPPTTTTTVPDRPRPTPTTTPPAPVTPPVPPAIGVGTGTGTGTGNGTAGANPSALFISSTGKASPVAVPPAAPSGGVRAAAAINERDAIAVTGDGKVFTTNPADNFGGLALPRLNGPVVNVAPLLRPSGFRPAATAESPWKVSGYWLVADDGGVFTFGEAPFHGSTGDRPLNQPVVALAPTPSREGYWLVAADGGVFTFGDARFHGSTGDRQLRSPIVSLVPTASGRGYWLVAADGGVFAFGDARFYGSGADRGVTVIGAAATLTGRGYWLVTDKRSLVPFGDATVS